MATPLLMIGPGGDYASRYYVKGIALAKQVGSTLAQQPDTETAGSFAGYGQSGRRKPSQEFSDASEQAAQATIDGDAFEHGSVMPSPTYSVTYGASSHRTPAANAGHLAPSIPAATAAAAAEAWLAAQQRTLVAIPLFSPAPAVAPVSPAPRRPAAAPLRQPALATRRVPLVAATELSLAASPAAYRTAMAAWPRIQTSVALPVLDSATGRMQDDLHDGMNDALQDEWTPQSPSHATPPIAQERHHESHSETATHPYSNSRLASGAGLLANDAGAGRRIGRQQSHRLRAHRGAHQKGSALAGSQQGTLFNS